MNIIVGNYTDYENNLLAAAYYVSNQLERPRVSLQDISQRYRLDENRRWLSLALQQFRDSGWSTDRIHNGPLSEQTIRLTAAGIKQAERLIRDNQVYLNRVDAESDVTSQMPTSPAEITYVDSTSWTGIRERLERDQATVAEIEKKIFEIDLLVEKAGLSDTERSRAKAISEALSKLISSPEPEWKAIVDLLNSPNLVAVLNVASIAQIALNLIFGIG